MSAYVVFPPRLAEATRAGGPASRASSLRRRREANVGLLRQALSDPSRADAAVSVAGENPSVPLEGSGRASGAAPLSLDALGAIIVRDPTSLELDRLKDAGATVVENVTIQGARPVSRTLARATAPAAGELWHLDHIGARAWHAKGIIGRGVLLGVIDTGVDADHPELAGRVAHYAAFGQDGSFVSSLRRDYGDHGTHVCGTIAGKNCGVAPGAKLAVAAALTLRGPDGTNSGTLAQVLAALNWLLQTPFDGQGVAAVNVSLGISGYDDFAYAPIRDGRALGGPFVVGAIGNNGSGGPGGHGSPGNYDVVLGIGATDRQDRVAPFSDHGPVPHHPRSAKPDMSAPGVGIVSAVPDGMYAGMDGTSMAAPAVTGACALLAEQDESLLEDPSRFEHAVKDHVRPLPGQPAAGIGVLSLKEL